MATDEAFEGAISDDEQPAPYTLADLARSLVFAIGYNIGQQAVLQARVNKAAKEVCFTGSFGSGHPLVMGAIDYAVRMNGGGEFTAAFLKHHQLRSHLAVGHAPPGTKPYQCEHEGCAKSFATKQKLNAHTKVHGGKHHTAPSHISITQQILHLRTTIFMHT